MTNSGADSKAAAPGPRKRVSADQRRRLAMIVTEFPKTTETFIMRDAVEFHRRGYDVRIYHLTRFNRGQVVHEFASITLQWAQYFGYLASPDVLGAVAKALLRRPGAVLRIAKDILFGCRQAPLLLIRSLIFLPKSIRIAEDLRAWNADHVHAAFAGHPATTAWIARRLTGLPYSVSCHAHDIFETRALLDKKLGEADFVRTISQYNRDYLLKHVPGLAARPPEVIHVGAFLDRLSQPNEPAGDQMRVLFVGSLHIRKGVDVLLRALAKADLGDWRLDIVGDGPQRARLEDLADRLRLSGRVTFHGAKPHEEVGPAMAGASVLVVPSRVGPRKHTEGLPTVIVEALAHQRPVIASRLTGIPEIVIDGVTGLLFEVDDIAGLVRALEDVRRDSKAALERALRGHELVFEQFDQSKTSAELLSLIDSSIDRHARRNEAAADAAEQVA